MRVKLVTKCGCTRFMDELPHPYPKIEVPISYPTKVDSLIGGVPSTTFSKRTFSADQDGYDELGRFIIYREM